MLVSVPVYLELCRLFLLHQRRQIALYFRDNVCLKFLTNSSFSFSNFSCVFDQNCVLFLFFCFFFPFRQLHFLSILQPFYNLWRRGYEIKFKKNTNFEPNF